MPPCFIASLCLDETGRTISTQSDYHSVKGNNPNFLQVYGQGLSLNADNDMSKLMNLAIKHVKYLSDKENPFHERINDRSFSLDLDVVKEKDLN